MSKTAMSSENEHIVRRSLDALAGGEGGVDSMLQFVDQEFEMVTPPELAAEPDVYRGHDGLRRWFDSFSEAMDQVRVIGTEISEVEGTDYVIGLLRMEVRGRSTGLEVSQDAVALCTVIDSKIRRMRFFVTREEAVAAAKVQ